MWFNTYNTVQDYIDTHDRLPSQLAHDPEHTQLATWIRMQRANYANNSRMMGNSQIRQEWEEFITRPEYAEYFVSAEDGHSE